MKFSPTELTEKAHLAHATWETILNPSVFSVLKNQAMNRYYEKERIKLKISFTSRKVHVDREERSQSNFWGW